MTVSVFWFILFVSNVHSITVSVKSTWNEAGSALGLFIGDIDLSKFKVTSGQKDLVKDDELRFIAGDKSRKHALNIRRPFKIKDVGGNSATEYHAVDYYFVDEKNEKLIFTPVREQKEELNENFEPTKEEFLKILGEEGACGIRAWEMNEQTKVLRPVGINDIEQKPIKKPKVDREDIEIKHQKNSDHVVFSNMDGLNDYKLVRMKKETSIFIYMNDEYDWIEFGLDSIVESTGKSQTKFMLASRYYPIVILVRTEKDLLKAAKAGGIALDEEGEKLIQGKVIGKKSDAAKYGMYDDAYDDYYYDYDRKFLRLMRLAKKLRVFDN